MRYYVTFNVDVIKNMTYTRIAVVCSSENEVDSVVKQCKQFGAKNIRIRKGSTPHSANKFIPYAEDFMKEVKSFTNTLRED